MLYLGSKIHPAVIAAPPSTGASIGDVVVVGKGAGGSVDVVGIAVGAGMKVVLCASVALAWGLLRGDGVWPAGHGQAGSFGMICGISYSIPP